ncbi:MAG: VCBS repeat-containing protein, partial [Acidobacteria bacterium]
MNETGKEVRFSTRSFWVLMILPGLALCTSFGAPLFPNPVFPVGEQPRSVAVGDFDGDGHADLAVANSFSRDISVLLGRGDGTFAPHMRFAAGMAPWAITLGDFDGDSHLDLAVANSRSDDVSVLRGNGDGTFAPQMRFAAGDLPQSIAVGDFAGDGQVDLVVANS